MNAKIQHYVPKFLLRKFCIEPKELIWVFDLKRQYEFRANIKNVAAENYFYDFEVGGEKISFEAGLGALESDATRIVDKIICEGNLGCVTSGERDVLALFVAVQHIRTRSFKEQVKHLNSELARIIAEDDGDPAEFMGGVDHSDKNEITKFMSEFVLKTGPMLAQSLLEKDWVVLKAPKGESFYIGDHPVVLHNENDLSPYGNLGFSVKGIQIYLPLDPTTVLGMWCPSLLKEQVSAFNDSWKVFRARQTLIDAGFLGLGRSYDDEQVEAIRQTLHSFATGKAFVGTKENVEFINSLQVVWSERCVFSLKAGFDLARIMIKDDPKTARGMRPTIG